MIRAKREPILVAKMAAMDFQRGAIAAVRDKEYAAVFHEQGLGKTKIGLDVILHWLESKAVDSVIIVTKRSLISNWRAEIANHTHFVPKVLTQDRASNYQAFNSPARVYLTHYEVISSEESRIRLFQKTRKVGILLDEAQKIKNPDASLTKAFHELGPGFARRLIMTGTPIANRPYDLWSQIFFLDSGATLGTDFSDFKNELDLSNDLHKDDDKREQFEERLGKVWAQISDFAVRETKKSSGIDLPPKTYVNLEVDLEERQEELYRQYRDDLSAMVIADGVPVMDEASDLLKRLLRLVEVASNPVLVDSSYNRDPGKMTALEAIAFEVKDAGEKLIVWTSFVQNADWLAVRLGEFGAVVIHGGVDFETRDRRIQSFKTDPDVRILVATPGSAKEGLTLTVANRAVFFDRSFSLDDYLQAQDRIHRISQTKECFIYNLIASDTVDEWVDELLEAKALSAAVAQGDLSLEDYQKTISYDFGASIRTLLKLPESS